MAEKWLDKVQKGLQTVPTVEFIDAMLHESEEFLWAGHEMDAVGLLMWQPFTANSIFLLLRRYSFAWLLLTDIDVREAGGLMNTCLSNSSFQWHIHATQ